MLQFYVKQIYGKNHYYFYNSDIAAAFLALTGRKTFTLQDQQNLETIFGQPLNWDQTIPDCDRPKQP